MVEIREGLTEQLTVRLPVELAQRLRQTAEAEDRTPTNLARRLIARGLASGKGARRERV